MKIRWSVNPIALYSQQPFASAFAQIAQAGFDTTELWMIPQDQVESIAAGLKENNLQLAAISTDYYDLVNPENREAYLAGIRSAIIKAKALNCPALITQVGNDNGKGICQHESIVAGLKAAAPLLEEAGITLLVEPLNTVKDHIGYYLDSSEEGFEIIREVNSPNVRLLFDIYHQLHMKEDVYTLIKENLPLIAHFHIAGIPARDEQLQNSPEYASVFAFLAQSDYSGCVGLELWPSSEEARAQLYAELKKY